MKSLVFVICLIFSAYGHSSALVKSVHFEGKNKRGTIVINFSGNIEDYPELIFNRNIVEVEIPRTKMSGSYDKRVGFNDKIRNVELKAKQDNDKVIVKAILPFDISKKRELVSLIMREDRIELSVPELKTETAYWNKMEPARVKRVEAKNNAPIMAKKENDLKEVSSKILNEKFLKDLEKEHKSELTPKSNTDQVKVEMAAPVKKVEPEEKKISLLKYGGKFVAFLCLVLVFFYGLVAFMRKGFVKKGKLGFLHDTKQVEVLGTTYIAPKKSLVMVKVNKQVFLIGNSDAGLSLISELREPTQIMKEGEKEVIGKNFDDDLIYADISDEANIRLKENLEESSDSVVLSSLARKSKFSDQIKSKVKGLKPMEYRG